MIPVPGLDSVRCAWVEIRQEGFALHGFLLFRSTDHYFPEYLEGDGLDDLNIWTGDDCAIFVVQSPSATWIEYTKATNHTWWKLFGRYDVDHTSSSPFSDLARDLGHSAVLAVGEETLTLRNVFAPCLNQFQHSAEIAKILYRFGLEPTEHPCLILFRDLKDRDIWFVDLRDLCRLPESDLAESLKRWFGDGEFKRMMEEARYA
jgi:hypothetical protein